MQINESLIHGINAEINSASSSPIRSHFALITDLNLQYKIQERKENEIWKQILIMIICGFVNSLIRILLPNPVNEDYSSMYISMTILALISTSEAILWLTCLLILFPLFARNPKFSSKPLIWSFIGLWLIVAVLWSAALILCILSSNMNDTYIYLYFSLGVISLIINLLLLWRLWKLGLTRGRIEKLGRLCVEKMNRESESPQNREVRVSSNQKEEITPQRNPQSVDTITLEYTYKSPEVPYFFDSFSSYQDGN